MTAFEITTLGVLVVFVLIFAGLVIAIATHEDFND